RDRLHLGARHASASEARATRASALRPARLASRSHRREPDRAQSRASRRGQPRRCRRPTLDDTAESGMASTPEELRILGIGLVGAGFSRRAFEQGLELAPHVIASDGGTSDGGPYFLGSGAM